MNNEELATKIIQTLELYADYDARLSRYSIARKKLALIAEECETTEDFVADIAYGDQWRFFEDCPTIFKSK